MHIRMQPVPPRSQTNPGSPRQSRCAGQNDPDPWRAGHQDSAGSQHDNDARLRDENGTVRCSQVQLPAQKLQTFRAKIVLTGRQSSMGPEEPELNATQIRLPRLKPSTNSASSKLRLRHSGKDRSDVYASPGQRCPITDLRKTGVNASLIRVLFYKMSICAARVHRKA